MERRPVPSMREILDDLLADGYTREFACQGDVLRCIQTDEEFSPHELKIVGTFRFDGEDNPEERGIVYVIQTASGTRGTIVDAPDNYGCPHLSQFLEQVSDWQDGADLKHRFPLRGTTIIRKSGVTVQHEHRSSGRMFV